MNGHQRNEDKRGEEKQAPYKSHWVGTRRCWAGNDYCPTSSAMTWASCRARQRCVRASTRASQQAVAAESSAARRWARPRRRPPGLSCRVGVSCIRRGDAGRCGRRVSLRPDHVGAAVLTGSRTNSDPFRRGWQTDGVARGWTARRSTGSSGPSG